MPGRQISESLKGRLPKSVVRAWQTLRFGSTSSHDHWLRVPMYEDLERELRALPAQDLDIVEISGSQWKGRLPWRSHHELTFPDFDLCNPPDDLPTFDVVVCDQVLEHVVDPPKAVRTLRAMVRPGGYVVVATPFLIRLHDAPGDYWRYTPDGMRLLLESAGLTPSWIRSWGNRRVLNANLDRWPAPA